MARVRTKSFLEKVSGMGEREVQLANLRYALGRLVDPILRYCDGNAHSTERARELRAQLVADLSGFLGEVTQYGTGFTHELSAIRVEADHGLVKALVHFTYEDQSGPEITKTFVEMSVKKLNELISAIPRRSFATVQAQGSPFKFYTWLRASCENISQRLVLIDPYPSASLFTRYLFEVPPTAACLVVTRRQAGRDWEEFDAASQLFSVERPNSYEAKLHSSLHDRYVLCDTKAYHIGPSIKDAAISAAATVSPGDFGTTIEGYVAKAVRHHPLG